MKTSSYTLAAAITLALVSGSAHADSWDLTQTTAIDSDTTLTQSDVSSQSIQAINAMNLEADIRGNSSQETTLTAAHRLTLIQNGTTADSTQAANYAKGLNIGDNVDGAFRQQHLANGNLLIKQLTSGSSNLQAMNVAEAVTNLIDLEQKVTSEGDISLEQDVSGNNNVQALNNAKGNTTLVDQRVEPETSLTMTQTGSGTNNKQFANNLNASATDIVNATQTVITTTVEMNQTTAGKGTQAANSTSVENITEKLDQSIEADITMFQTGVGVGSLQAGNYLLATGVVEDVAQTLLGDLSISLEQRNGETNIIQAGNLLDASADTADIRNINQAILAFSGDLSFTQANTLDGALQAGNALLSGATTGTATQEIDVASLNLTQENTQGSIQAANYAGIANN